MEDIQFQCGDDTLYMVYIPTCCNMHGNSGKTIQYIYTRVYVYVPLHCPRYPLPTDRGSSFEKLMALRYFYGVQHTIPEAA